MRAGTHLPEAHVYCKVDLMRGLTEKPTIALITKRQLARKLRKTVRTINKMIHRGELPAPFHIGREAYWNLGTLVAFLDRLEKQEQDKTH